MGLVTEYPAGFAALCLVLGAGYAVLLYYLDLKRGLRQWTHRVMFALRLVSVTLIAFLLLGPLVRQSSKLVEKPVVVLGIDNSRSMVLAADSEWCRKQLPPAIEKLAGELRTRCDVRIYSFGDHLADGFDGSFKGVQTDMSAFFAEVSSRYSNRNAAALVIASDGIYNEGTDPFYAARGIAFPIYSIPLGDTALKKDILIRKVLVNKTAFKGDRFPVEVLVGMDKCAGQATRITLSQGSAVVGSREVRASGDRALLKIPFMLEAKEKGLSRYTVQLAPVDGESNQPNNTASFIVEVLDARQKIALVYSSPHPDIYAIRKALDGSAHFETDVFQAGEMPKSFDPYDLIILHQLPSVTAVTDLSPVMKSKASLLMIAGSQTDINTLNGMKTGVIINASRTSFTESQPVVNEDFPLFSLDKKDLPVFREFPPLQCPFGSYQISPMSDVLFSQKINGISTASPMILFTRNATRKIGFIAGENIWRWRLSAFTQKGNHEPFDLLVDRIARYLSTREDKSFFRIHLSPRIPENQPVEMDAEVFNATYELTNDPEAAITITDASGKSYPFTFSKTNKAYFLNAGLFPVGEYSWKATTKVGSATYTNTGKFFIEPVNVESAALVADHNLMYRLAASHDGAMVNRDSIGKLAEKILARDDIRSVSINQQRMSDLVGNPWLFILILALLSAEWVIRKREGL